jgi:hypothetical protein
MEDPHFRAIVEMETACFEEGTKMRISHAKHVMLNRLNTGRKFVGNDSK